jgi:hypothetical protein
MGLKPTQSMPVLAGLDKWRMKTYSLCARWPKGRLLLQLHSQSPREAEHFLFSITWHRFSGMGGYTKTLACRRLLLPGESESSRVVLK